MLIGLAVEIGVELVRWLKTARLRHLLGQDLSVIVPDQIRVLLQERSSESEWLDYGRQLDSHVLDTLAAMANASGGLVVLGVEAERGRPVSWPGLDGEGWLRTLADLNALDCQPPVAYEARLFYLTLKPLLLVRVHRRSDRFHVVRKTQLFVRKRSENYDVLREVRRVRAWDTSGHDRLKAAVGH